MGAFCDFRTVSAGAAESASKGKKKKILISVAELN